MTNDGRIVQDFIQYFSSYVEGKATFKFCYKINSKGSKNNNWIRHNSGQDKWDCKSLNEAFQKYFWADKDYFQTKQKLDSLSSCLMNSYEGNDESKFLKASWEVLKWGGVTAHNSSWLLHKFCEGGLIKSFTEGESLLVQHSNLCMPSLAKCDWKGDKHSKYRMNAGYTKIYSLLFDNFIIYDSRVAAALGYFVSMFCKDKLDGDVDKIPEILKFPYLDAKEAPKKPANQKKVRNPAGLAGIKFAKMDGGVMHAQYNSVVNKIIYDVVNKSNMSAWQYKNSSAESLVVAKKDQMRALESALFMLGYDLSCVEL